MAQAAAEPPVAPAIAAYVGAAAALLGLPLRAEHRAGVEQHFSRLAALARLVDEHALDVTGAPAGLAPPGAGP